MGENGYLSSAPPGAAAETALGRVLAAAAPAEPEPDSNAFRQQEARLLQSERLLKETQRLAQIGHWELDLTSNRLHWSDEMFRICEIDRPAFDGSFDYFLETIHPADRQWVNEAYRESVLNRKEFDLTHRVSIADDRIKWVRQRGTTHYCKEGWPLRSVGTVHDVTAQRAADERLRLSVSVFDNSLNAILITSPNGVILEVNRAFSEITGYPAEQAIGNTPRLLRSQHHGEEFYQAMWASLKRTGSWQGEIWNRHRDGRMIPIWQRITAVYDAAGAISHYIGIFFDLTEQKQAAQHIHRLAHYDVLTDLPNRLTFNEFCAHAVERAKREGSQLAVLFLDLDRFKHLSDQLDHAADHALLPIVAQHLKQQLREADIVARLGGDKFIVALENVSSRVQAERVAGKLVDSFAQAFIVHGYQHRVSISIGISLYPADGKDVSSLVTHSEVASYRAKEEGRNAFRFFERR